MAPLASLGTLRGRCPTRSNTLVAVALIAFHAPSYGQQPPSPPTARPILWVLSIGVSAYADPNLTLRYGASDARALAAALERQADGPLYSKVETRVLADGDVSRASILRALDEFLGQAAPIDVGVVYLAGHGVRDPARDAFYFLPQAASAEKPHIEGLEMADFNRQLRLAHRNLRRLVVVLDTCHSGAIANLDSGRLGVDLAARLAPAEGLYILTAARSGEGSLELPSLGHGLFTYGLIDGLQGAAANPDGLVTVFGLAGHAARVVRRLSEDRQHPYQAIVGEDLVLGANAADFRRVTPPPLPTPELAPAPAQRERVVVLRFENLRPDPEQNWMEKALREEFTTALATVTRLDVYEEPEMQFLARGATDPFDAAQRAGMEKLVGGSYWIEGERITITADVKSVYPLQRIASARIAGPLAEFFTLRGKLVLDLLAQWHVELPANEAERIAKASSTDLGARELLYRAENAGPAPTPEATPSPGSQRGAGFAPFLLRLLGFAQPVHAADGGAPEADLRTTLESYRTTFASRDVDALARFYVQFSAAQRESLARYFANAESLEIEFSDVRMVVIGEEASVSFTRRDRFIDRQTGERQQVVVRLTKRFMKGPTGWQVSPEE